MTIHHCSGWKIQLMTLPGLHKLSLLSNVQSLNSGQHLNLRLNLALREEAIV